MTRASPMGERVATVETKIESMEAKLDNISATLATISERQETMLANQASGAAALLSLDKRVSEMAPDVKIVTDARVWGRWTIRLGAAVAASVAAIVSIVSYLKPFITFNWPR